MLAPIAILFRAERELGPGEWPRGHWETAEEIEGPWAWWTTVPAQRYLRFRLDEPGTVTVMS